MKLKLDLHPIRSDGESIEAALRQIIDEACEKRAAEVEIIPGKGSGALKKSVLRFLDRPEVKSRYHRVEKDSENWGRLFVHFRWDRSASANPALPKSVAEPRFVVACFCCQSAIGLSTEEASVSALAEKLIVVCATCASPNKISVWRDRANRLHSLSEPGY